MSDNVKKLIFVAVGAAALFGIWKAASLAKKKRLQEEEAPKQNDIPKTESENSPVEKLPKSDRSTLDIVTPEEIKNSTPQIDYYKIVQRVKEEEKKESGPCDSDEDPAVPYVITPYEFGEEEGYSKSFLYYFADRYLTNEKFKLIDDIEKTVGFESLNHFGEQQADTVFVRNDNLKMDFEITKDERRYVDIRKKSGGDGDEQS